MSRLSRIGLPLSMVSSTARRRECFCTVPRQRVEIAGARVRSERLPLGQCRARGSDRGIDIGRRSLGDRGERLAGGRVGGIEVSALRRLPPRAVNEMSEAATVMIQPGQASFGIFGRRAVFHGDEFFSDAHMRIRNRRQRTVAAAGRRYAMGWR